MYGLYDLKVRSCSPNTYSKIRTSTLAFVLAQHVKKLCWATGRVPSKMSVSKKHTQVDMYNILGAGNLIEWGAAT